MSVHSRLRRLSLIAIPATVVAAVQSSTASAVAQGPYQQTNLVANRVGTDMPTAQHIDPHLVNPWGISAGPATPFWVSDNGTGVTTLYANGTPVPLVVTIPPPHSTPGATSTPTGTVFNGTSDFQVAKGQPARFLFATEDGTISGWNPNVDLHNAILEVDNSRHGTATGAVYKGLAIGSVGSSNFLYAANFRAGVVERYDKNFHPAGRFTDRAVPAGFAPFDVQNLGGMLWVTFAMQNAQKHDNVAGPGNGFVDVFDTSGNLLMRFASHGALNSPWGLAMAPSSGFGPFSGDLLVGNFGDGIINAFDPETATLEGQLGDANGDSIVIDGLWGLRFGNDGAGGPSNTLFFTAGINHEADGLYGSLVSSEG